MNDKVVVITGASSGIGAALAHHLGAHGAQLVLVGRRQMALEQVAAGCGGQPFVIAADMTIRADVQRVVQDTLTQFDRIDVWVNNVGRGITRNPSLLTDDDIDDMMRVNVKSALYGMQEILPYFMVHRAGHIINVSSMLARIPFAVHRSAYSASKHFLNALTAMFRDEVRATHPDIQVSLVSPGVVRTEFGNNALHGGVDSHALPRSQSAEEVAAIIADVITTRAPDVYTRDGSAALVASHYAGIGVDPSALPTA
jgi:short-subunit dehydrogenase